MRPYNDADADAARCQTRVVIHDSGEYVAAEVLWRQDAAGHVGARRNLYRLSKPFQQEPANS